MSDQLGVAPGLYKCKDCEDEGQLSSRDDKEDQEEDCGGGMGSGAEQSSLPWESLLVE